MSDSPGDAKQKIEEVQDILTGKDFREISDFDNHRTLLRSAHKSANGSGVSINQLNETLGLFAATYVEDRTRERSRINAVVNAVVKAEIGAHAEGCAAGKTVSTTTTTKTSTPSGIKLALGEALVANMKTAIIAGVSGIVIIVLAIVLTRQITESGAAVATVQAARN